MKPYLSLSEAALNLITHAAIDIPAATIASPRRGRILTDSFGGSTDPKEVFAETALLRLVSIVEAYVDAVSAFKMGRSVDSREIVVLKLLEDFEVGSSSTWQQRKEAYIRYQGFSLESRDGWQAVAAAIEVRNCLAHGLGSLTAKQRQSSKLPRTVGAIDVTLGGGRVYLGRSTISVLGTSCSAFVRDVDTSIGPIYVGARA